MPDYRRVYIPGGTYFFTVKTFERKPILTQDPYRTALRQAIIEVRALLPFESIAWILLPDHLHTLWKLPEGDANFSLRWSLIKQRVTRHFMDETDSTSAKMSRQKRREERSGSAAFGSTWFVMISILSAILITFTTIPLSTVT